MNTVHLLLHCEFAYAFSLLGVIWVMLCIIVDALVGWSNWFNNCLSAVWNLAPLYVLWQVWNSCTFEGVELSEVQLRLSFFGYSMNGLIVLGLRDSGTITEFPNSISFNCNSLDTISGTILCFVLFMG